MLFRSVKAYMKNSDISTKGLMKFIKGPDFPTGGIVVNKDDLAAIYETGTGKIKLRGKVEVEEMKGGKKRLVITEIPYTMIGAGIGKFLNDVCALVESKKTTDIVDISNQSSKEGIRIVIDLKPALSEEQLDHRVLREFEENQNRQFKNAVHKLFPSKLIPVMIELSGIDPEKKVNVITKEERLGFVRLIKNLECTLTGLRDYNEAIITKGGIKIKEVDPGTMESRLVKGLHFAGEVLDLDAVTGGFNLQIAWSTAYAAGTGIESADE